MPMDGLRLPEFWTIWTYACVKRREKPTHSRRGLATTCLLHPALPGHAGGHQERLPDQNPTTKQQDPAKSLPTSKRTFTRSMLS